MPELGAGAGLRKENKLIYELYDYSSYAQRVNQNFKTFLCIALKR